MTLSVDPSPSVIPRRPLLSLQALRPSSAPYGTVAASGHLVFTHSGRSALRLALVCAGFGPRDTVLIPNYYCPTMIAPAESIGCSAVFYPIRSDGTPNADWLDEWLKHHAVIQDRGRCALLAAHFFGLPIDMSTLKQLCERHRVVLIEDCAHAYFGSRAGVPVGATGHYAIASLPKFFPSIQGGLLRINSPIAAKMGALPQASLKSEIKALWNMVEIATVHDRLPFLRWPVKAASSLLKAASHDAGSVSAVGSEVLGDGTNAESIRQAALRDPLLKVHGLRRIERWIVARIDCARAVAQRRENYLLYTRLLEHAPHIRSLFPGLEASAVPYVYPIHTMQATRIYARLRAAAAPALRWDRFWPGAIDDPVDVGRDWGNNVIQLSCHQDLSASSITMIVELILGAVEQ